MLQETRHCQNCKQSFLIEPEDFDFYKKIEVPPPTWCPQCRSRRRMIWRNERNLYRRKCDLCEKAMITMYRPEVVFPVFCRDCWLSDKWDPFEYGREFDETKPFLQQLKEVMDRAPHVGLVHYDKSINSEYANYLKDSKDVYLSYSTVESENIAYSFSVDRSRDCFDCLITKNSELAYELVSSDHCYRSAFLVHSRDCTDSKFLFDCVNCRNCFMSSNLRNRQYVFRNKQLDKKEYEKAVDSMVADRASSILELRSEFKEMAARAIRKYAHMTNCVFCTGDDMSNSKNAREVFNAYDVENARWVIRTFRTKDVQDVYSTGADNELLYEGMLAGHNSSGLQIFTYGNSTRDSAYVVWCQQSANIFGSYGLRSAEYCILNKQYTKEEYERLVSEIIAHMDDMPYIDKQGRVYKYGEFFPPEFSPFPYNESVAQEYLPLEKKEAESQGWIWSEAAGNNNTASITWDKVPDSIKDTPDDILKEVLSCNHAGSCVHQCTWAFRITPSELDIYRRLGIPLPRLCPNCRFGERATWRNPPILWHRQCMCELTTHQHQGRCPTEFETSYSPERKEIVYCEACYNAEVA